MKHQEVMDKVQQFSEEMLLHYSAPNRELIVEVLQYNSANLSDLLDVDLSKYILVLGQYLVMLRYNSNLKNIEKVLLEKTFEFQLNKNKFSVQFPSSIKTEKDKRAWLLTNDEELSNLELGVTTAEAEASLIYGMSDAIEALLNALKKEKSSRGTTGEY